MPNASPPQRLTRVILPDVAVHVAGILPLLVLLLSYLLGRLGFNPIEALTRQTGRLAVIFLLLSLACTPLRRIFHLPVMARWRKPLGLYASLYAGLHFAVFMILDYGFDLPLVAAEIIQKPFIIIGAFGLIILIVLALTSFQKLQRRWGKFWRNLHRLVYAAGLLILVHYFLAIKGDLLTLQGGYWAPLLAGGVLLLLFILRLPFVWRPLSRRFRQQKTD
jgi:methionine sulfoxide reductase heme-binding subunit